MSLLEVGREVLRVEAAHPGALCERWATSSTQRWSRLGDVRRARWCSPAWARAASCAARSRPPSPPPAPRRTSCTPPRGCTVTWESSPGAMWSWRCPTRGRPKEAGGDPARGPPAGSGLVAVTGSRDSTLAPAQRGAAARAGGAGGVPPEPGPDGVHHRRPGAGGRPGGGADAAQGVHRRRLRSVPSGRASGAATHPAVRDLHARRRGGAPGARRRRRCGRPCSTMTSKRLGLTGVFDDDGRLARRDHRRRSPAGSGGGRRPARRRAPTR